MSEATKKRCLKIIEFPRLEKRETKDMVINAIDGLFDAASSKEILRLLPLRTVIEDGRCMNLVGRRSINGAVVINYELLPDERERDK
jgi:hypothetical protein